MRCLRNKCSGVYSPLLRALMRVTGRIFRMKVKLSPKMNTGNYVGGSMGTTRYIYVMNF